MELGLTSRIVNDPDSAERTLWSDLPFDGVTPNMGKLWSIVWDNGESPETDNRDFGALGAVRSGNFPELSNNEKREVSNEGDSEPCNPAEPDATWSEEFFSQRYPDAALEVRFFVGLMPGMAT